MSIALCVRVLLEVSGMTAPTDPQPRSHRAVRSRGVASRLDAAISDGPDRDALRLRPQAGRKAERARGSDGPEQSEQPVSGRSEYTLRRARSAGDSAAAAAH